MMFRGAFVLAALSASSILLLVDVTNAFQPSPLAATSTLTTVQSSRAVRPLQLQLQKQNEAVPTKTSSNNHKKSTNNVLATLALAGTIFASTLTGSLFVAPPSAHADVELSTGAVIIQTSAKQGQSLLKAEVDVKDLLGSLIKNRKALKESVGRIGTVVKEELTSPVWRELTKEILQFEGDVTPEVNLLPPRDIQQTIRDVSQGKLNLIVNGEIINLSIDKSSTAAIDEIVIRAKGVRGVSMPSFNEPVTSEVRTRLEDQIDAFNEFWYSTLPVPEALQEKLPPGTELTMGTAILGGGALFIGGTYGAAYAYYLSEQEAASAKAEAQRKLVEDRKKKAAEIAVKKKKAEEEKKSE